MTLITEEIRQRLLELQDLAYRDFNSKLIPNVDPDRQIGIRTPALRAYAKELSRRPLEELDGFFRALPHFYYEENNLHGFLLEGIGDYDQCMERLEEFLPYVDNWATCDTMAPKVFRKHRQELLGRIREWLTSEHTYTVRYGVGMLMREFLDEDFKPEYLELVAGIRSQEYYVNMMIAWYFATALAKQWEAAIPYIQEGRLEPWCHNKTIQKAVESYRITAEQKKYLRTLRKKNEKAVR